MKIYYIFINISLHPLPIPQCIDPPASQYHQQFPASSQANPEE